MSFAILVFFFGFAVSILSGLKLPTRVVIGSNLALVFLTSVSGFIGKLGTGQIPLSPFWAL